MIPPGPRSQPSVRLGDSMPAPPSDASEQVHILWLQEMNKALWKRADLQGAEIAALIGRVAELETDVGEDPNVAAKTAATGLKGGLVEVREALTALTKSIDADLAERAAFRAFLARLAWGLGLPGGAAALIGLGALVWHWFATLHH